VASYSVSPALSKQHEAHTKQVLKNPVAQLKEAWGNQGPQLLHMLSLILIEDISSDNCPSPIWALLHKPPYGAPHLTCSLH
jgi:hypothetical protein